MTKDPDIDLQVAKPVGHIVVIIAKSMVREQISRQPFLYYLPTSYSNEDKPFLWGLHR